MPMPPPASAVGIASSAVATLPTAKHFAKYASFLPPTPAQSDRGYGLFSFSLAITTPRRRGCFKPQHGVAIYGYLCTEAAASRFCHCQCAGSRDMFYYRAGAPLHLQCPLPARPLFCPIGLVRFFSPTIPFSVGPGLSVVSYNINSVAEVAISNR